MHIVQCILGFKKMYINRTWNGFLFMVAILQDLLEGGVDWLGPNWSAEGHQGRRGG